MDNGCERPPPDTFATAGFDLGFAVASWAELAKGEVTLKADPRFVSLISTVARDERLHNYLDCLSIRRDGYTKDQVAWYNKIAAIGKATPSAEQLLTWLAGNPFPPTSYDLRLVVMDSRLRVYDKQNLGTNARAIRAILSEMGSRFDIRTELATPDFVDEEYVLRHRPNLLIIHLSSFYPWDRDKLELDAEALQRADKMFREFVAFMLRNSTSKVLVYTRGMPDLSKYQPTVARAVQDGFARQTKFVEEHKDRVRLYVLPGGKSFNDPEVARSIRDEVRILIGQVQAATSDSWRIVTN